MLETLNFVHELTIQNISFLLTVIDVAGIT